MHFLCEGCGTLLRKKNGKWVVAKKNQKGEWVEVSGKHDEGVKINEEIFFKCLNCDYLNKLPESSIPEAYKKGKSNSTLPTASKKYKTVSQQH